MYIMTKTKWGRVKYSRRAERRITISVCENKLDLKGQLKDHS